MLGVYERNPVWKIDGRWLFYYNGRNWKQGTKNSVGAEYGIGIAVREE